MAIALITGASSGIGKVFAQKLAAQGHSLVLVARELVRLEALSLELQERYGIQVELLQADLCEREQLEKVAERLRDSARPVEILVNNAGLILAEPFIRSTLLEEERLLDVLVRAVLVLTHAAVPGMVARGSGTVIVVSSVAGFSFLGTYSAAKAWATTFVTSVAGQLHGTGVNISALCPGYVRTEIFQRAGVNAASLPRWAWIGVDRLVEDCLNKVRRGRVVIVPSFRYKLLTFLSRHLPLRLVGWLARQQHLQIERQGRPPK